jgi:hypothetical protein
MSKPPLFPTYGGKEFKQNFAVVFLATYCATHYDEYCASDRLRPQLETLPAEDAEFLAEAAWKHLVATLNPPTNAKES